MTLIEGREALEPRILSNKRPQELDSSHFDEPGSDDEFLIANEGYPEDGEHNNNNNRDFFSLPALPTLGLNYLNNLNLSLNLNLNLRNTTFWRIYENTYFTKPGFLTNYLGKHSEEGLDLDGHEITSESGSYFTITNFLRRHGFPSYEEDYSEEAVLERIRFKKLQQAAEAAAQSHQKIITDENNFAPLDFHIEEKETATRLSGENFDDEEIESNFIIENEPKPREVETTLSGDKVCTDDIPQKDMRKHGSFSSGVNPFYNRVEVTPWDAIKIGILTATLFIVKFILIVPFLLLALFISLIGMYGITFEETQKRPLPKWRRALRWIISNVVLRGFILCSGFVWSIKETGKRATPEEAPIFVVGPHSSYFDAFAVILLGSPSVVAKLETKDIPIWGRLITFTQAVFVSRESKKSRKQTTEVLKQRAQEIYNGSGMPQIYIYPEGTCSNRSSLIKFKVGAFVPQVPVQPVLLRYPNRFDPVTWTFDGPPVLRNIWYAYAQFYNKLEIEYLPVYVPNEEEKNDPCLYAENVRRVMAEALDIPMSDYQFEDGLLLCAMRGGNLVQKFRAIHRAKKALGLSGSSNETEMILQSNNNEDISGWEFHPFQRHFFFVESEDTVVPEVQIAFNNFKLQEESEVDIRQYLIHTSILYEDKSLRLHDWTAIIFKLYNLNPDKVTEAEFKQLMKHLFECSKKEVTLPPTPHWTSRTPSVDTSADEENNPIITCWSPTTDSTSSTPAVDTSTDENKPLTSDDLKQRISRYLEFAKLFADEVTERLPKNYPSREDRDKLPKRKQKTD